LSDRRRSSLRSRRASARELSVQPKTVELEVRVARLELIAAGLKASLDLLAKRVISLQAHLDHISAKLGVR
jgi:hypothetical protein